MQKSWLRQVEQSSMRLYVQLMMEIVGRGLVAASQTDAEMSRELKSFAPGTLIQMMVLPDGPGFTVQVGEAGVLKQLHGVVESVDVGIRFKHLSHAFLVLSFQESTATAFAHDRMYVDGDISYALRLVRCLNRMEALILPRLVAERAVKRYPQLGWREKVLQGAKIYQRLALNLLRGV